MNNDNKIQTLFNTISSDYDKMNNVISFNQHNVWRKRTNKELFIKSHHHVLDLCCGTGDWSIQMAKDYNANVIGLDFSKNMLDVARDKANQLNHLTLIQGDAMYLPFEDNCFDFVTIGFGLRNLPDYQKAMNEVQRVLKPGGMFVILETSNPESKLFRLGFDIYFGRIMPKISGLLTNKEKEYVWLYESTKNFLSKEELKKLMEDSGFINIKVISHTFGTASTHIGIKPL